ncbi:MAG: hypothetical protein QF915_05350, partial [Candidatus Woesearchaeota archaeon]|nr:hypothetical protein [Candidatus Woesearchaeota archaeon]
MSIKSRIKRPKLANPPTNFDEEQSSAITTSPLGEEARKDIQTWFADFWKAYNPENNHTGLPTGWEGMPFMSFDNRIVLRYQITHFMNQYVGDHSFDDYVSAGKALGYRDDIQTSFITRGFPDGTELEFLRRGAEDPEWAIRTWLTQSRLYSENIDVDIGGVTLKMINTPDTEELCFMMAAGWNEMARKIDIRNEIAAKGIIPEEYRDGEKWVLPFTNQESMTGIISNLMNHLVGPGENPSLESRELLEKFFKKYNLNATFGD